MNFREMERGEKKKKENFFRKFFLLFEIGQKKCPKMKNEKKSLKKYFLLTIIENQRHNAKKIFFTLLRQNFILTKKIKLCLKIY